MAMQIPAVGTTVGDSVGVGNMEVKVRVKPEMSVWGVTVGCCGGHRLMELVLGDVVLVGARMVSRSLGCGVNCDGHTVNEGHS